MWHCLGKRSVCTLSIKATAHEGVCCGTVWLVQRKRELKHPQPREKTYEMSWKKSGVLRNERYTEDVDRWMEHWDEGKKKWKINTTAQWYYVDYLCLLSIETKHTQQPNPQYSCHRNDTYVHVPKGTHTTVHTCTLCNSPTLQTTAGLKAEWFNCYVVIKLIN